MGILPREHNDLSAAACWPMIAAGSSLICALLQWFNWCFAAFDLQSPLPLQHRLQRTARSRRPQPRIRGWRAALRIRPALHRPPLAIRGIKYCVDSVSGDDLTSGSCSAPRKTVAKVKTAAFYSDVTHDTGVGFQDCPGGCSNQSGCAMNVKYYNNTVYIARNIPNSYGLYAETT